MAKPLREMTDAITNFVVVYDDNADKYDKATVTEKGCGERTTVLA